MVAFGLWVQYEMRWVLPSNVGPCMVGRVVIVDKGRYVGWRNAPDSQSEWYALFAEDGEKPLVLRGYLRQIAMQQIAYQYDWYFPTPDAAREAIRKNVGLSDAANAVNLRLFEGESFYE